LRIEYSPSLLREVRIANSGVDAFGTLYGVSHGKTIRVVATRGRAGLEPVGVFASRVRGQVFLTEEDLERFDRAEAAVALVVSGQKGGFFVRDAAGSIETVRSYEEFSLQAQSAPAVVKVVKRRVAWTWCLALLPLLYFIPRAPHKPQSISLREDSGQLRIGWNLAVDTTLTILDGSIETSVAIHRGQSMLTYARRTGDVVARIGSTQSRFVGPEPPLTETRQLRESLDGMKLALVSLKAARAAGQTKIADLERRLQ
jgi:hypothetical protein